MSIPPGAKGVVLFAHGSGSSRMSPRNRYVAEQLQQGGLATLLFDLLTQGEETQDAGTGELRFNVELLAARLSAATDWLKSQPRGQDLRPGYFGASTGAAAALVAAAQRQDVFAVVSRGGRPDLAGKWLQRVTAPALLMVGGLDGVVIDYNREAFERIPGERKALEIIPGASHLFEEPGTLEQVAQHARDWFLGHLPK